MTRTLAEEYTCSQ